MSEKDRFIASSGNVFADLELDDPEAELARAELAIHIRKSVSEKTYEVTPAAMQVEREEVQES